MQHKHASPSQKHKRVVADGVVAARLGLSAKRDAKPKQCCKQQDTPLSLGCWTLSTHVIVTSPTREQQRSSLQHLLQESSQALMNVFFFAGM
jgi:hypothetical protein